jgi:hypothetical protein
MVLNFWRKKKKKARKPVKHRPRLKNETARTRDSQRRDDEILLKLDVIMTFLRKHDMDVKDRINQLAVARRILKETNLDEIIKEKFSQSMKQKDIIKELVSQGACSRATAYRYVARQSEPHLVSVKSQ